MAAAMISVLPTNRGTGAPVLLTRLLAALLATVPLVAPGQTTHTWQGTTADLATGSNWSNGVVPSAGAVDQMVFNGSGTIHATTFPGGTFSANPGLGNITITGGQTQDLSFINVGAATPVFRLANDSAISIAAGAGAVTFGGGGNAFFLNLGQFGAGNQLINNSANTATIAAPVTINATSGTNGLAIFGGSGDWLIGATISGALTRGVTMDGSGTLTLTANNAYGPTTISSGTVRVGDGGTTGTLGTGAVTNNAALVFDRSNAFTVGNSISGTGSLTMEGSGVLTLSAANSFSGGTTIDQGTIRLANGTALGASGSSVVINPAGTLDINAANTNASGQYAFTLNGGTITNTGGEQQHALRFVTLTADSTFAGTGRFDVRGGGGILALDGHTLTVTNSNKISIVDSSITGGGIIDVTSGTLGLTRSGGAGSFAGATIRVGPGATLDFENNSSAGSYQANLELSSANVLVRGSAAAVTGAITLQGNNIFDTTATFTASGPISGTGGLTKTGGAGSVFYLDGNNSYSGPTNVNSGYLVLRNSGGLGNSDATVASGATLQLENNSTVTGNAVTISGTGVGGTRGALASWTGNNTWTGPVTMAADSSIHVNTGSFTISGVIDGAFDLTKTGGGTLTFANANAYTGTTTVSAGVLNLDSAAPTILGNLIMNGGNGTTLRNFQPNQFGPGVVADFTSASGAWNRFDLRGNDQTLAGINTGDLTTLGGGVIQNREQGNSTASSYGPATLTLDGSGSYLFHGHLRNVDGGTDGSDTLSLIKNGSGTQILAGDRITYTGNTTINDGTLVLARTNAFASNTTTINPGGTLELNSTNTGVDNWRVNTILAGDGTINVTGGGWVMTHTNPHTFSGTVNIQEGTFGASFLNSNWSGVTADFNISSGALLDARGQAITVGSLNGDGTVGNTWNLPATVIVGAGDKSGSFAGTIQGNASTGTNNTANPNAGVLSLIKTGTGTQILSGDNTYTGITDVQAGTLLIDGDNSAATGNVTVQSGATLGGGGIIGGATVIAAGGALAPGNSAGTLTFNQNLTLAPGATFEVDVLFGGTDTDLVVMSPQTILSVDGATLAGTWGGSDANIFRGNYSADTMFWIVDHQGTAPIDGRFENTTPAPGFAGLFDGVTPYLTTIDGQLFAAFYESQFGNFSQAGLTGGNDLLLMSSPSPRAPCSSLWPSAACCCAGGGLERGVRHQFVKALASGVVVWLR